MAALPTPTTEDNMCWSEENENFEQTVYNGEHQRWWRIKQIIEGFVIAIPIVIALSGLSLLSYYFPVAMMFVLGSCLFCSWLAWAIVKLIW